MKYLKVFADFVEELEPLSDAECGRLFKAMLLYAGHGTEPDFRGNERFLWAGAKKSIDRQDAAYQNKVQGAEKARDKKGLIAVDIKKHQLDNERKALISSQDKEEDKDKDKDKEKREKNIGRFTPPTVDEVRAYCKERHNTVNPERFVAWYEANGWKVGKNPMKNWKAAVRTWEDGKAYSGGEVKKSKYDGIENLSEEEEDFRMRYADVIVNGSPLGCRWSKEVKE